MVTSYIRECFVHFLDEKAQLAKLSSTFRYPPLSTIRRSRGGLVTTLD